VGDVLLSLVGERLLGVLPGWIHKRIYPDARLPREGAIGIGWGALSRRADDP
jgi:hypothetical protein